jgi:hypothetical protein
MIMKRLVVLAITLMIAACSSTPVPTSMMDKDWKDFGYERALKGLVIQSESTRVKKLDGETLKDTNYQSYLAGYKAGQAEYCQKDAYILGVKGEPYNGICDVIDWTFREDYSSGRHSTAGGM